ncbi:HAD family hydrolase [Lactiplantibacillus modestisalitolerans]|uniref:HAD family hydrolase n=1 Tax=Lactiplantibacillus modestisalitolerans TaxID=1457219 RepID=A0ABV5WT71_9LACO|nr:HAD family hydrolase [Lactiplantibacillus modestisalitolerans]
MREFLWDLDGTLLDTYPVMVQAMQTAVSEMGGHASRQAIYTLMREHAVGYTQHTLADQFGWDWQLLRARYRELEAQLQTAPAAFPGAQTVLAAVVAAGGHNYLMTHRDARALDFLTRAGLADYFSDAVTAAQPFPRKPDPAALNYLLDRHQVDRRVAVMVGDRNLDIEAGHRAGIAGYLFDYDHLITVTSAPERQVDQLAVLQSSVQ